VILGLYQDGWKSGPVPPYEDVSANDWSVPYVSSAYNQGILPIAGQTGPKLLPNVPLERGEAAAYVWNGLHVSNRAATAVSSASAQQSSAAAASSNAMEAKRAQQRADEAARLAQDKANNRNVSFPFNDQRLFTLKQPLTYTFHLSAQTTMAIQAALGGSDGTLSCRLYKIAEDGFSTEYYLGYQEGTACSLLVTVPAGDYQLLLAPSIVNASVTVSAKTAVGDGNDGFSQAKNLEVGGRVIVDGFGANDLEDWYVFTVSARDPAVLADGAKTLTVSLTSSPQAGCAIYPMADVDLFGFAGPSCNQSYAFPAGTYMVDLRHPFPIQTKMTYSISVK
jgi:hypothetical protein